MSSHNLIISVDKLQQSNLSAARNLVVLNLVITAYNNTAELTGLTVLERLLTSLG